MNVTRAVETEFGTVLVPFTDGRGKGFVVEMTRSQWRTLHGEVQECFARVDRQIELGKAMLSIDRHESVV